MNSFHTPDQVKQFVTGGNATITIESKKTGAHYTYRVRKSQDGNATFVSVLAGPDNESDYVYAGLLDGPSVRPTKKSRFNCDSASIKAINYALGHIAAGQLPPHCEIRHEGRCGVCNRTLTTPESLDRGIGPECWSKMGA